MKRLFLLLGFLVIGAIPTAARADVVGQTVLFSVNSSFDAEGASAIHATLRVVSAHAYFYVDDRWWATLSLQEREVYQTSLARVADFFDGTIYPRLTALWGREASPGVDGDPRITILLERLSEGSGGYFENIHSYPVSLAPQSNAREMLFVNPSLELLPSLLAHELQHLLAFNQREFIYSRSDDVWINEARSEYSVTAVGLSEPYERSTLQRRAQSFARTPSDSLVEWPNTSTDYAIASLWAHYLVERFGVDILQATLTGPATGAPAIDAWLAQRGQTVRFGDVFTDWMVAVMVNDRALGVQYSYAREGLASMHVTPEYRLPMIDGAQMDIALQLEEWQPIWVEVLLPSTLSDTLQIALSPHATAPWQGALMLRYADGSQRVQPFASLDGVIALAVPTVSQGAQLRSVRIALTQGVSREIGDISVPGRSTTLSVALGSAVVTPTITPAPAAEEVRDGDLIRREGSDDIYVVWGPYRRYLTRATLALYGFSDRPVMTVSSSVFDRYRTSNYIRAAGQQQVYAVWPDGTKHWLHITAAQWDASARDWGAIFTVNDAEIAAYRIGADITQ